MPPPAPVWPDFLLPFLQWMATNQIADVLALFGIVGVIATLVKAIQSKRAAEAARDAAISTRTSINYIAVLSDFAAGIAILEEIKRYHRSKVVEHLPDRYAALRKILISVRAGRGEGSANASLTEAQQVTIQTAIVNLAKAEETVEHALAASKDPDFARLNKGLSQDLDNLLEILVHLKSLAGGHA